jgi:hypothetical protein
MYKHTFMIEEYENGIGARHPRFYRAPSEECIKEKGQPAAEIHARIRARVVGSRVMNALVAFGTGTGISLIEILKDGNLKSLDIATNYALPAFINGIAQLKIERQLIHTENEITVLLPSIIDDSNT